MKIIEAHKIIADAIGDNIDIDLNQLDQSTPPKYVDNVVIADGVRFTKYDREWYLYRGMQHVLAKRILVLKHIRYNELGYRFAISYFPQSLKRRLFDLESSPTQGFDEDNHRRLINPVIDGIRYSIAIPLFARIKKYKEIINEENTTYEFSGYYPLPIRTVYQTTTLLNGYLSQKPDYMIEQYTDYHIVRIKGRDFKQEELKLEVFNGYSEFYPDDKVELQYIENIPLPNTWYGYNELPIDLYLQNEAISKAIEYMMIDNQDVNLSPSFLENEGQIQNLLIRQE